VPAVQNPVGASWLRPAPIAPAWHTVVLILGIALLSFAGAKELTGPHAQNLNRMHTYGLTVLTELVMLAWVWLGLRLRRIPFSSIFGDVKGGWRNLGTDFASAGVFWIGSLFLLGTINAIWMVTDAALHHRSLFPNGKPDPNQQKLLDTLTRVAPSHGLEFAAWILVCVMAGITEEIVFRGYFQRQFTAWARGTLAVGAAFSAILFGCGHGYQGARQMVLLTIFGVLFSLLSMYRRNIRAGIIAHAWQDIFAGVMISVVHALHPF
jgi:membrane protease YdiL (CAAX protease family)